MISFAPFRELIKKRKISTYFLRTKCGEYNLDNKTIDRLMHDDSVTTYTLNSLCNILNCGLSDIVEFIPVKQKENETENNTHEKADSNY